MRCFEETKLYRFNRRNSDELAMSPNLPDRDGKVAFQSTRWSLILKVKDQHSNESREALEQLCQTYWYPLYAYVRRRVIDAHEAMDITQGFFTHLLEKSGIDSVNPDRGRFRAFMLASVKNFLRNDWRSKNTQRRGGDVQIYSLHEEDFEQRFQSQTSDTEPDCQFERDWVASLLRRVMERLRSDYEAAGRTDLFELLHPYLVANSDRMPQAEISEKTGLGKSAVKMSIHRMRKQYARYVREEISETLDSPEDVEDELTKLIALVR